MRELCKPAPTLPLAAADRCCPSSAPGSVRALAKALFPTLTTADYAAVGERVTGSPRKEAKPRAGARRTRRLAGLLHRRGFRLSELMPQLAAHSICPGNGYDRLICLGEACDHGREARARA